jgi:hypothetical protein
VFSYHLLSPIVARKGREKRDRNREKVKGQNDEEGKRERGDIGFET